MRFNINCLVFNVVVMVFRARGLGFFGGLGLGLMLGIGLGFRIFFRF